jgi:hypothetical protein
LSLDKSPTRMKAGPNCVRRNAAILGCDKRATYRDTPLLGQYRMHEKLRLDNMQVRRWPWTELTSH